MPILDFRAFAPPGSPIPQADQRIAPPQGLASDQVASGTRVRLLEVPDSDPEFLRHLDRISLKIGTVVVVDQQTLYADAPAC